MKLLNYTMLYISLALFLVIGIWAFVFYLNMLDEIYDSIDDGLENSKLLIINKVQEDSTLLYKTELRESNYAIHPIHQAAAQQFYDVYMDSTLYMQNEEDYESVRILKTAFRANNGHYYNLMVVSSMVEEDDLIEDLLYAVITLYVILMVSILVINNLVLRRLWKPFYSTLEKLGKFNIGKGTETFMPVSSKVSEFNNLNATITSLINRTIKAFTSQKQFIENAAHELQTPLAISINKLELLIEKNALAEDNMEELVVVTQNLQRLTRLNKTLLLLSRIENKQFSHQESVNFNDLARHVCKQFEDFAEYKSITLQIRENGTCIGMMNTELAELLLSNLIKNAIIHNYKGGKVTIMVGSSKVTISNSSDQSALDETKIFDRFYKSSLENTSTGLGLAIVKSIADVYGLTVRYHYQGIHTFSINFV